MDLKMNEIAAIQDQSISSAEKDQIQFYDDFRQSYKMAQILSTAKIIPENYQNSISDCMVAIDMACRMHIPVLMVMQSMYVVKGKPVWSGQACIAFIRNKFQKVQISMFGEIGTDSRGCQVIAVDTDGTILEGTPVTMAMAREEGWISNKKWKNMPEQMLKYRAASFFARAYCPEILMGTQVEGEVEDSTSQKATSAPDPFAEGQAKC